MENVIQFWLEEVVFRFCVEIVAVHSTERLLRRPVYAVDDVPFLLQIVNGNFTPS